MAFITEMQQLFGFAAFFSKVRPFPADLTGKAS